MKDIMLLGKKVLFSESPVLLKYAPDEDWLKYWNPRGGNWKVEDGYLVGEEKGNKGGILLSRERFEQNVMLSFTVSTVLPATRDLNAVYCANWDETTDYLGDSYVCGLNGWYEHKSGIERNLGSNIYTTTSLYKYTPGTEVRMTAGAIGGHNFMVVDDVLVSELIDPMPIKGGYVGFSPYCTKLKIKDIEIREILWEKLVQEYEPEF
ncbi:MAG: hypothetical protein E7416_04585 [Ruminococcaceae bacterium]|nr:hypothetical protein [Oscillospiraceae bacterium]